MTNPTIETDIAEILREIKQDQKEMVRDIKQEFKDIRDDLKSIDNQLNKLENGQTELREKFQAQEKILSELKNSQNKQIWALIALAFTTVVSAIIGFGKFLFFSSP